MVCASTQGVASIGLLLTQVLHRLIVIFDVVEIADDVRDNAAKIALHFLSHMVERLFELLLILARGIRVYHLVGFILNLWFSDSWRLQICMTSLKVYSPVNSRELLCISLVWARNLICKSLIEA